MAAELRWISRRDAPTAVVLVLHGGQDSSRRPARWHNLAVLRMVPVARAVANAGHGTFAVAMLRYAVRGWNGAAASPVPDARAALDEISAAYPGVPIAPVGHSWVEGDVGLQAHDQQKLLLIHGVGDRMTSEGPAAGSSRRCSSAASPRASSGSTLRTTPC